MIYLASPFFNEKEITIKKIVKDKLDDWGYVIHDPQNPSTNSMGWEKTNDEWGYHTFIKDSSAIDKCQFVVAIYWGMYSDTGTAWEIGYAFGCGFPTLVIVPDEVLEQKHSLMIANGSSNFIALSRFLSLEKEEFGEVFNKVKKKFFLRGVLQT